MRQACMVALLFRRSWGEVTVDQGDGPGVASIRVVLGVDLHQGIQVREPRKGGRRCLGGALVEGIDRDEERKLGGARRSMLAKQAAGSWVLMVIFEPGSVRSSLRVMAG